MDNNEVLIKKLLNGSISSHEINQLMASLQKADFRNLIKRIFDINQSTIVNDSTADSGFLGMLNKLGKWNKNRGVINKLNKPGFRDGKKIIIAEGDSWFEYPIFLTDIPVLNGFFQA